MTPKILHVGCGGERLPPWLPGEEVRLDIDPKHNPDIVGSILDMGNIGGFDKVFCCHILEHVYPHEVPIALSECHRVLKAGGGLILFVPNLDGVQATEDVVYTTKAGMPITGLDMIYGARWCIEAMPYMAHHTGFVPKTLHKALTEAGFRQVAVQAVAEWNLLGVAVK